MSEYTTQLRYILTMWSHEKPENIDANISKALPGLFDFNWPFYADTKKIEFETRFCEHFYMREIGAETAALFKLYLKDELRIQMPYFNKLLLANEKEFDFLETDNAEDTGSDSSNATDTSNNTGTNHVEQVDENIARHNDTPQGSLTDFLSDKYMSNADHVQGNNSQDGTNNNSSTAASVRSAQMSRLSKGRRGVSPSELLRQYYSSQQNIYDRIFDRLGILFFGLL